jgi:ArsR family transcriptional regulator
MTPMERLLTLARVLSDPTRVRVLALLRNGELCVCELVDALGIGQSSLSSHLQICREAGVLTTRKESRWIYYSLSLLSAGQIKALFSQFQGIATDRQLREDAKRLKKRLQMREAGRCVVGFGQLEPEREAAGATD